MLLELKISPIHRQSRSKVYFRPTYDSSVNPPSAFLLNAAIKETFELVVENPADSQIHIRDGILSKMVSSRYKNVSCESGKQPVSHLKFICPFPNYFVLKS